MNRSKAIAAIKDAARIVERVFDTYGSPGEFEALKATITAQEKGHRRFTVRFTGGSYKGFPVSAAVSYFIVRTFASAAKASDRRTIADLHGLRADYRDAEIFVAHAFGQAKRGGKAEGAEFQTRVDAILAASEAMPDYSEFCE